MRRAERLSVILDRVAATGSVDVLDLAEDFNVSGATIRRDLSVLSDKRLLVRTHGGALAKGRHDELPAEVKAVRQQAEKRRIGRAAAELVESETVIGMTGGSTALEVVRALPMRRPITVVTNAINVAAELVGRTEIRLVVIGGILRPSYEAVGPAAESMLSQYHFDIAFVGVDGISAEYGCTTYDEMEAQSDLAFLRRARRRVVIADASKLGKVTFARISGISDVTDVITDAPASHEDAAAIARAGVNVVSV
ncbi:MAG: DeoR/GlpR family DNA-binding transcription regulator [Nocardioidaceae bacterium]|jgi:DeoR family transcriptional regulator of aga operon|nr:DeoR/GlpR family DNA-binding transcription regulator [Nocardioidaceae bacterium]